MTDKEMLELAAKANWRSEVEDGTVSFHYCDHEEAVVYIAGENQDHNGSDVELVWNPLDDDGEALRLAVKLKFDIMPNDDSQEASTRDYFVVAEEKNGDDACAALRRAIVRAAAEIGKRGA